MTIDPPPPVDQQLLEDLVAEVRAARKYRGIDIPTATLYDLLRQELERRPTQRAALQAVREKLHNIVAPYLGDPHYPAARVLLEDAFQSGQAAEIRAACLKMLSSHASTRERIPLLESFYPRLWQITGQPKAVLDLACGLHPFGLPWMSLDSQTRYFAYDLHRPRVDLLNHFFRLSGLEPLAYHQDILVRPPEQSADVAFFFKEAHRFEQRRHGCNRVFWQALNVRWLLVSLPASNLTGRRSLVERQRGLVQTTLAGLDWPVTETTYDNELVFCIQKS